MAAERRSRSASPLQLAIANLLRTARSELDDARLVLRRGNRRNASALAAQALAHVVESLAASEHGWPLVEWNTGARAIPEANPYQPDLADLDAAMGRLTRAVVEANGQAAPVPEATEVTKVLERITGVKATHLT